VVFNILGAALGAGLVRARPVVGPLPGHVASRLGLAAALAATAVFALTGLLTAPGLPATPYYAFWTPELPNLEPYRGRILGVTLGDLVVPPGRPADSDEVRDRLLSGERLRVQLLAGPPVARLAPLLSVKNAEGTEVLFLGVDRQDLVLRRRTRAATLRLDAPEVRVRGGADRLASGGAVAITVMSTQRGHCVGIDTAMACGLGFTIGAGWTFVLYSQQPPAALHQALSFLWVAVLTFPSGFWARWRWESAAAICLLFAGLLLVPLLTELLDTPTLEETAAIAGLLAGSATRSYLHSRVRYPSHLA
jgi:hypothetical protein